MANIVTTSPKGQGTPAPKNKGQVSAGAGKPPKLAVPPTSPFGALVANQQKVAAQAATKVAATVAATNMPNAGVATQQAAKLGFTRTIQNGRGNYTPNSIGALIWQTATALQALTPNTPVQAGAVRLALPHVAPASISAGLSHWRKFCGTMRIKGQGKPPAPAVATPVAPAPVLPNAGTVAPGSALHQFASAAGHLPT